MTLEQHALDIDSSGGFEPPTLKINPSFREYIYIYNIQELFKDVQTSPVVELPLKNYTSVSWDHAPHF